MATWGKVKHYFNRRSYCTAGELLDRASEVSRLAIVPLVERSEELKRKQPPRPLSPFARAVLKLAPEHLNGQYRRIALTVSFMKRYPALARGRKRLAVERKVSDTLSLLKKQGLIPVTAVSDKPRAPRLRVATNEDIRKNKALVHLVLSGKARGNYPQVVRSSWRNLLSSEEATAAGRIGLVNAIETYRPERGAFSTHAAICISTAVRDEMRRKRRQTRFKVWRGGDEQLAPEVPVPPRERIGEQEDIERVMHSGKLEPHELMVLTLNQVFGHNYEEIGLPMGASRQAIHHIMKGIRKKIGSMRASQEAA
ncbi:MAG: sigma-70 family RNA polymerase sigma factor [Candidatus Micrarchaeota archaeon]